MSGKIFLAQNLLLPYDQRYKVNRNPKGGADFRSIETWQPVPAMRTPMRLKFKVRDPMKNAKIAVNIGGL